MRKGTILRTIFNLYLHFT